MLDQLTRRIRRLHRLAQKQALQSLQPKGDRHPFGLEWMRAYLGRHLKVGPSRLHLDLASDLRPFHLTRGQWRVYECARGSAKTTWVSRGYPLYCAVEGLEPYILLLSDTTDQAEEFLDSISGELLENDQLARDYPQAVGRGSVWRKDRIRLRNGVQIVAKGAGSRVRGRSNRGDRPSLVIADDCNQKEDAYSPTLRRRKWDWFSTDVMAVGTARTNFLVVGTPIHREVISHRLRTTPGWKARGYKSIISWPSQTDLWHQWETILTNLADPLASEHAREFYESNRAAMDAGAEVLWAEWESLYDLMKLRAAIGPSAFDSEKQDRPGTDGATEWPDEWFDDPGIWFQDWPDTICRVQALDPSKGASSKTGDFQAHIMAGVGCDGVIYLEAELRREHIGACVERAIDLAAVFQPHALVAESNATMGLLLPEIERQLSERARAGKPVLLSYEELISTDPKAARIRTAGGYLSRKQIRVRNTPGGRELVAQWRGWPNSEYDDGPDAAGVAIRRLQQLVHQGR